VPTIPFAIVVTMVGTLRFAHPTAPSPDEGDRPETAPFALIPIPAVDTVPRDSKPPARA